MNLKTLKTYDERPKDIDCEPIVLVVDDDLIARNRVKLAYMKACDSSLNKYVSQVAKFKLLEAASLNEAECIISSTPIDVVLLDKEFSESTNKNGIDFIPEILKIRPLAKILIITGSKSESEAVKALNLGAIGYVHKDTPDTLLISQIQSAIKLARSELALLRRIEKNKATQKLYDVIAGSSEAVEHYRNQIIAVAETDRAVLILGESGTGKTYAAKLISDYRQAYLKQESRIFVQRNIAAIPHELIESELFGHEKGAFTGAVSDKQGVFELGHGGTIFLDEIGEASLDVQAKLLKVIDERKFIRVGGTKEISSAFKLICATNKNLEEMVQKKEFRSDLLMRIKTFVIEAPSLEDRKEDIPDLIQSLLPNLCRSNKVYIDFEDLPKEFIEYCQNHKIEGNVRGLEQYLSRLLVLSPKDDQGKPVLDGWKAICKYSSASRKNFSMAVKKTITIKDIQSLDSDFLNDDFPGFQNFLTLIKKKLFTEAKRKGISQKELSSLFKMTQPNVCVLSKRFQEL